MIKKHPIIKLISIILIPLVFTWGKGEEFFFAEKAEMSHLSPELKLDKGDIKDVFLSLTTVPRDRQAPAAPGLDSPVHSDICPVVLKMVEEIRRTAHESKNLMRETDRGALVLGRGNSRDLLESKTTGYVDVKTPLSNVDRYLEGVVEHIRRLIASNRTGEPIVVVDWGCGNYFEDAPERGQQETALAGLARIFKNEQVIFIGFSAHYFASWHNAPANIIYVLDDALNLPDYFRKIFKKKIDFIYSYMGLHHLNSDSVTHFVQLSELLKPGAEIRNFGVINFSPAMFPQRQDEDDFLSILSGENKGKEDFISKLLDSIGFEYPRNYLGYTYYIRKVPNNAGTDSRSAFDVLVEAIRKGSVTIRDNEMMKRIMEVAGKLNHAYSFVLKSDGQWMVIDGKINSTVVSDLNAAMVGFSNAGTAEELCLSMVKQVPLHFFMHEGRVRVVYPVNEEKVRNALGIDRDTLFSRNAPDIIRKNISAHSIPGLYENLFAGICDVPLQNISLEGFCEQYILSGVAPYLFSVRPALLSLGLPGNSLSQDAGMNKGLFSLGMIERAI